MNAKYLIFGSLAAMAVLVGALLFAADGDGAGAARSEGVDAAAADTSRVTPLPAADSLEPADSAGMPVDTLPPADAGAGGGSDASPTRPAEGARDDGAAGGSSTGGAASGGASSSAGAPSSGAEPGRAGAQAPETAALLRATASAYRDVRAMQAEFEQELENTLLGRTVTSSGTLYQRQPDRFLMRFTDPAGDVIVSDGSHFWLYFPSTDPKQVIRTRRGAQGLDLQSQFIGDPVSRFQATYHGRETDRGRATHVLSLVPREPLGYRKLKVWIDDGDHLIRRFELTEENGIVRHFVLSGLRLNPSLPDRLFEFTPPEGARVVDQG